MTKAFSFLTRTILQSHNPSKIVYTGRCTSRLFSTSSVDNAHRNSVKLHVPNDDSLKHPDFFGVQKLVTVENLFNARVHYGHKKGSRNE